MPRAGFVTLAGKPNAGKSTLLNRLIGEPLSITSPKPQSTRDRVVGILTRDAGADPSQLVFLDTPGLLEPRDALQHVMRAAALKALTDANVIVYLVDATAAPFPPPDLATAADLAAPPRAPTIVALNKIDALSPDELVTVRTAIRGAHPDALLISASTGQGVDALLEAVTRRLPESPFLYPSDDISTQSVRFFVTELIRETALEQLHQELPYSVAAQVEEFRETSSPVYIRAVIYVERDSQQRILIGHHGSRIKELGRAARLKIERLVESPVYLDLRVKVLPNWRRDANALRRLGYVQ